MAGIFSKSSYLLNIKSAPITLYNFSSLSSVWVYKTITTVLSFFSFIFFNTAIVLFPEKSTSNKTAAGFIFSSSFIRSRFINCYLLFYHSYQITQPVGKLCGPIKNQYGHRIVFRYKEPIIAKEKSSAGSLLLIEE